jgi:hypothetical protein
VSLALTNAGSVSGGGFPLMSGTSQAALDIDFVHNLGWNNGGATIASLLTCTRASTGYYQNADGTLTSFGNDVLRYGSNGLLVEEARTNLTLQSNTFSNAAWTKNNVFDTSFATTTTAPDTAATGSKLTETTTNAAHYMGGTAITKAASAIAYTYSVYAKAAERSRLMLVAYNSGATKGADVVFDVSGVQIGVAAGNTNGFGTVFTSLSASITPLANGWTRCVFMFTSDNDTTLNFEIRLDANTGTQAANASYAGTNGNGVYIFGAQVEAAAAVSSYIPTTASSATRALDVVTVSASFGLNNAAGTFYGATYSSVANGGNPRLWGTSGVAGVTPIYYASTTSAGAYNGATVLSDTVGSGFTTGPMKTASAYTAAARSICSNNGTVATDANSGGNYTGAATVRLGTDGSLGSELNGYITRVAYWPVTLSNAALQVLTT